MRKIFVSFIFLVLVLFGISTQGMCASHPVKTIAVITDTGHRNGTNYLISGAASDIIATDIVNRINMTGRMKAPLLGDTMSKITQQNIPLYYVTFLNEYKYNYNIDFVNLKRVTRNIPADYIVMVTSGLDIQSNFLKDTWWNKLNIPGMDPVKPTYKLSTLITLIDKRTYNILWQDLYLRDIEARNYDLGAVQFSPSYAQLSKIKKYSKNMSEYVVDIIDKAVNPWIVPPEEPKSVEMRSRFVNEGTKIYYPAVNGEVVKQNFNEFKNDTQIKIEKMKQERQQKKQIENVRRLEKQEQVQKQNVQNVQNMQNEKTLQYNKKKKDQKLFESIIDDIDDVSNTLPPQKKYEPANTNPAVYIKPNNVESNKQELQLVKPVMNKPAANENLTPAVNVNKTDKILKPVNKNADTKQEYEAHPEKQKQQKELPHYDWNLKNIYLQKIGSVERNLH